MSLSDDKTKRALGICIRSIIGHSTSYKYKQIRRFGMSLSFYCTEYAQCRVARDGTMGPHATDHCDGTTGLHATGHWEKDTQNVFVDIRLRTSSIVLECVFCLPSKFEHKRIRPIAARIACSCERSSRDARAAHALPVESFFSFRCKAIQDDIESQRRKVSISLTSRPAAFKKYSFSFGSMRAGRWCGIHGIYFGYCIPHSGVSHLNHITCIARNHHLDSNA